MKYEEIIQHIRNGNIAPIYLLHGEEPYFIDKIADEVQKHALTDEERGFNETIIYGKDINSLNLKHKAMQFPMGAKRQLILVREAQNIDKMELMISYFNSPLMSTILVISYKHKLFDKRTKAYIALSKQPKAVIFESKKLYDNQMEMWVSALLREKGLSIEPRASALLVEFLGNELEKLALSVEKLMVAMGPNKKRIELEDVATNIGISKEYNPFELQSAIISKNVIKANKIVNAFAANPKDNPIQAVVAILFAFFSKLLMYYYLPDKNNKASVSSALRINPFFFDDYQRAASNYKGIKVMEIISLLREYDMKSKGFGNISATSGDLLKELVFKILH